MPEKSLKVLIPGGKATAGPPLGPALGPMGLNVVQVVDKINEATSEFMGMRVPVEVFVDTDTKKFRVEVGTPTLGALLAREISKEKGSGTPGKEVIGNISMKQAVMIAKLKMDQMTAKSLRSAVKQVLGTCLSMGVTVEGRNPKEIVGELERGAYDDLVVD